MPDENAETGAHPTVLVLSGVLSFPFGVQKYKKIMNNE
jgi:hypothetical protein